MFFNGFLKMSNLRRTNSLQLEKCDNTIFKLRLENKYKIFENCFIHIPFFFRIHI